MKPLCFRSYRPALSGYGYGTTELLKAFKRRGWRCTFQPGALEKHTPCKEGIVIHSGFPHFYRMEPDKIHIARVMLESDSLPRLWANVLNTMDEVWVAAEFNVKTFAAGGVDPKKLVVVPEMVDPGFVPAKKAKPKGGPFSFLSVFLDLSLRKGWEVMLHEFATRFAGDKNAEWVVRCSSESARKLSAVILALKKRGHATGNIKVIGKEMSMDQLLKLYQAADCYVLPTRGEGFGRPYLEAAACGLPVIATGWSGHMDFLNSGNSRLLQYNMVDVPVPDALDCYFLAGQKWAEPSHDDLGRALREMLRRPPLKPVDLTPFSETRVLGIIEERLAKIKPLKKGRATRKFDPQITVYDDQWRATQPGPKEFAQKLRGVWRDIAVCGTGRNAGQLARFLLAEGFSIPFFIDRKPGRFMGKKVFTPATLPKTPKPDMALISAFPASFPEWKELMRGKLHAVPVIFYEQADQP